jgi:hypothetical protein
MTALGATFYADGRPPLSTPALEPALCSGMGQYHSPTAKVNPRPLQTITLPDVLTLLEQPQAVEKSEARWFIPSTLASRCHAEQRAHGVFHCLWAETDEPSGTLRDMAALVVDAIGAEVLAYTTRSATEDRQKSRFLVPLAEPVSGEVFVRMQEVLNDHLEACGIPPDRASERAGQLCYLPNRGVFYDAIHLDHERLHPDGWREPVAAIQRREQEEQEQARRQREASRLKARARASRGQASPVAAMNAEYRLPDVLLQYGYRRRGNRWLSPLSESGHPAVIVSEDGRKWISSHGSDAAAGLGRECTNGRMGDVFDLYTHFEHGGDRDAALQAAAALFELPDVSRNTSASGATPGAGKRKDQNPPGGDPCNWTQEFIVSDEEIRKLKRPEWIIHNLVIRGHLVIVVAEPNGGKTTIFAHLAGEMVQAGFRVFYVNADISGSDAAAFIETSKAGGWTALLPALIPGMSMQDVMERLQGMNDQGGDLSRVVFIFDTLKKMTDVIDKKSVKNLLKLLRSLTGKGMTVILLGHTNKYKDGDGKPIFEGTGDVRADADELIYLIPQLHPDKSMTVSTEPNKVRGDFHPITFEIDQARTVTRSGEYIDTGAARMAAEKFQADQPDVRAILDAIETGKHKQTEIIEHCRAHRISKRTALRILDAYSAGRHQQWESQRAFEKNTIRYHLTEKTR